MTIAIIPQPLKPQTIFRVRREMGSETEIYHIL